MGSGPAPSRQAEALKKYLLDRSPPEEAPDLEEQWDAAMSEILTEGDEDSRFIKSWLQAKYATGTRAGKGRAAGDYGMVEEEFAEWVRDNPGKMSLYDGDDHARMLRSAVFYGRLYVRIRGAAGSMMPGMEHAYYVKRFNVPDLFYYPALIAPVRISDGTAAATRKVDMAARFLEALYVLRKVARKSTSDSILGGYMFEAITDMRDMDLGGLAALLGARAGAMAGWIDGIRGVRLGGKNRWFIHHLLARMTSHVESASGCGNRFEEYVAEGCTDCHTIEHLLPRNADPGASGFDGRGELCTWRDMLGGMVLLPDDVNRSLESSPYADKIGAYRAHNLLAASLDGGCYGENPSFARYARESGHPFRPYRRFGKDGITERQELYAGLCREIWNPSAFAA